MLKIRARLAFTVISASTALAASLLTSPAVAEQALAEAGKRHYIRCSACHALSADGPSNLGPHLENIVGRLAGSLEDYEYTEEALTNQSFHWDEATLEEWLRKPQEMLPDMCMPFFGLPRAEHREALIAYLKNPTP